MRLTGPTTWGVLPKKAVEPENEGPPKHDGAANEDEEDSNRLRIGVRRVGAGERPGAGWEWRRRVGRPETHYDEPQSHAKNKVSGWRAESSIPGRHRVFVHSSGAFPLVSSFHPSVGLGPVSETSVEGPAVPRLECR